jgi:hypothetical protein
MIFPDNICAAEFNFYGPRASSLSYYFALKLSNVCPGFKLNPLVRQDLQGRLSKITDLKVLDMKLRASHVQLIRDADQDLGSAIDATIKAVSARDIDEIEVRFVRKKKKNVPAKGVPSSLLAGILTLAGKKETREVMSTFKIEGIVEGGSQAFDILSEQFAATKAIEPATDGKGGVDSVSMFSAITEAYQEVQSTLATAPEMES